MLRLAFVLALPYLLLAQGAPTKIYKRKLDATTYHLADCPFTKSQGYEMVEAALDEVVYGKLTACTVCRPERNQELTAAVAARRREMLAEEQQRIATAAAEDKRKTVELDASVAKLKSDNAAKEQKRIADEVAALAEQKRLESTALVRVTQLQARTFAKTAALSANNDPEAFQAKFRSLLKPLAPEFSGAEVIEYSDGLKILLAGPLAQFEADAMQHVRKFEPVTTTAWVPDVSIIVSPERIDALDIEKVIVQRNGVVVPPLRSSLVPQELVTAMNARKTIHAGVVHYSLDSFMHGPGITVNVIAVPVSGSNIVKRFDAMQLRRIQ